MELRVKTELIKIASAHIKADHKEFDIMERAFDKCIKRLRKEWKSGMYCEIPNCKSSFNKKTQMYTCGKNDKRCQTEIKAHFLSLAKKGIK
jgi:uncharacterized protein YktB (UPF0637 family)